MDFETNLKFEIMQQGADFVHYVDISQLSDEQNKHYTSAILIGITLSAAYIQKITSTPDYVPRMISNNQKSTDEFYLKEAEVDRLADFIADYLKSKGYAAFSQSEVNLDQTGFYDEKKKRTPLPHKTIAVLAGLGWIGKHNLLITPDFGSALCICTVLTDAPLTTVLHSPANSQCGSCSICATVCSVKAIKGRTWDISTSRDEMVDVYKCNCCLECLAFCPWTQKYVKKKDSIPFCE